MSTLEDELAVLGTRERFTPGRHHAHSPRFKLAPFDEIEIDSRQPYLVDGLIPRVGIVVVYGQPKSCKSFWTMDALLHVAIGWDYRGRYVSKGPVVYIACEGASGYGKRKEAFRREKLNGAEKTIPFYLITQPVSLAADAEALIEDIEAQLGDQGPSAIAIDTLNRTLDGSESSDQDMSAYIHAADVLRDRFQCAVIIVHHSGVDKTRPRGHTSLTGAADAQLHAERKTDSPEFTITVEWMKDGPEGQVIASTLRNVEVGTDDHGNPITSCVVEPAQSGSNGRHERRAPKLPDAAKTALRELERAIAEAGTAAPPGYSTHVPPSARVVTTDLWRKYAYQGGISRSSEPRARQMAFERASDRLVGLGIVRAWEPYVWIPHHGELGGEHTNTP